jgi:TRAP-type C4-dicarboxylate transport system permease small subunit
MRLLVALGRALRPWLDRLYDVCGALAGLFLVAILVVIVLQMAARWSGQQFPGSTDYAGYCMAAASFFALAYALNRDAHIRVSLLLSQLGRWRRLGELWCVGVSAALACYFAYYAIKGVHVSYQLHDISQGQDATPLWIPQLVMAIGGSVFALALVDRFLRVASGGSLEIGRPLDQDVGGSG